MGAAWLQVTLQDQVEIAGEDSEAITTFLETKVERMIQKARSRAVGGRPAILPLIRLRVSPQLSMCLILSRTSALSTVSVK